MMDGNAALPPGLVGKEDVIFGNMREIYEFHNRFVFLIIWMVWNYTNEWFFNCW